MHKAMKKMRLLLPALLVVILLAPSCKNKKKLADTSDPQEVAEQIEQEIEEKPVEKPKLVNLTKNQQLNNYFSAVTNSASDAAANNNIKEALTMFSSPESVVLVEIYHEDGQVDYDEPTTISKYLYYLKDTGNNVNRIEEVVYDDNGKIKELILRKTL